MVAKISATKFVLYQTAERIGVILPTQSRWVPRRHMGIISNLITVCKLLLLKDTFLQYSYLYMLYSSLEQSICTRNCTQVLCTHPKHWHTHRHTHGHMEWQYLKAKNGWVKNHTRGQEMNYEISRAWSTKWIISVKLKLIRHVVTPVESQILTDGRTAVFKTQSKKLSVLLPWISNHKHKIEANFKKSSRSPSKVVCFGQTDWQ